MLTHAYMQASFQLSGDLSPLYNATYIHAYNYIYISLSLSLSLYIYILTRA